MTQLVQAIFENGVFRPLNPVQVAEHEQVALVIESSSQQTHSESLAKQRDALSQLRAAMDALPQSAPLDGLGGADHDAILYSGNE